MLSTINNSDIEENGNQRQVKEPRFDLRVNVICFLFCFYIFTKTPKLFHARYTHFASGVSQHKTGKLLVREKGPVSKNDPDSKADFKK